MGEARTGKLCSLGRRRQSVTQRGVAGWSIGPTTLVGAGQSARCGLRPTRFWVLALWEFVVVQVETPQVKAFTASPIVVARRSVFAEDGEYSSPRNSPRQLDRESSDSRRGEVVLLSESQQLVMLVPEWVDHRFQPMRTLPREFRDDEAEKSNSTRRFEVLEPATAMTPSRCRLFRSTTSASRRTVRVSSCRARARHLVLLVPLTFWHGLPHASRLPFAAVIVS